MASLFAMHLVGGHALLVALTIFGLGLFGMGVAPSIQHRVESLAGPGGGSLAASLPASAANAGDALGSLAGGASIEVGGASAAIITAAVVAVIAVAAAWATRFLKPAAELPARPVTATR